VVTAALVVLLAVESAALVVALGLLWRRREPRSRDGGEVEERYHMLIDRMPATVAVWDTRTRVVSFVSAQIEQLTGELAAMWSGADGMRRFTSRVHPDDLADPERWRPPDDPLPSQYRWTRHDGRTIWIRELLSPISETDVLAILSDVTAEVEAAAGLAEQRQRYQTLVEQLPVATFVIGVDGTMRYISPQIEQILGLSVERALEEGQAPGGPPAVVSPRRLRMDAGLGARRVRGAKRRYSFETRLIHADGSTRHARMIGRALKDESGGVVANQGVVIDVTDEVRILAERDSHLRQYETLIEQTPVTTYVTDERGIITYASRQVEQMLGYTPDDLLLGMDVTTRQPTIFHPDDIPRVNDRQEALLEGSVDSVDEAVRLVAHDGSLRFVQFIARRMVGADGGVVGTQGVVVDLTELRAAEQRSHEVLGALVTAAEDERARIATELHDDTVQVMTALLMHVRMMMRNDPGLERFEQLLSEALDRTRRLMFELRPHVLQRSGLGAAIDELAVEGPWREAEVEIDVARQTDTLEAVAYRALRELIVNARQAQQGFPPVGAGLAGRWPAAVRGRGRRRRLRRRPRARSRPHAHARRPRRNRRAAQPGRWLVPDRVVAGSGRAVRALAARAAAGERRLGLLTAGVPAVCVFA
jgi:PAS domain S-box-containing protein